MRVFVDIGFESTVLTVSPGLHAERHPDCHQSARFLSPVNWLYPLISDPVRAVPPWAPLAERLKPQVGFSLRTAKHVVQARRRARVLMSSVRLAEQPRAQFLLPGAGRAEQVARRVRRRMRPGEPALWLEPEPRVRLSLPAAGAEQVARRVRRRMPPGEPALWLEPEPRVRLSLPAAGAEQVARRVRRRMRPGVPAFCSQPQLGFSLPVMDRVARARRQARWQEAAPRAPSRPQAVVRVWQRRARLPPPVVACAQSARALAGPAAQPAPAWGPAVRPRVPALQQESDRP
jgi:hypothetical protein